MDNDFSQQRANMVQHQLIDRGIRDRSVLQAMREVPREHFVLEAYREHAYRDGPIPLPAKQTISQPYVVAYMLSKLGLQSTDRVLEIGTGSGYAAAILSRIVAEVYTVERHDKLAAYARERLAALGYTNVHILHGDGSNGWPAHAPYDGIVVAAGGPHVPAELTRQLKEDGRLIMPVGKKRNQRLIMIHRQGPEAVIREKLVPVRFVPLIGKEAWQQGDENL